jgi:acetyltransferase
MSTYRLETLFAPRSVAVVGASPRLTSTGRAVLENLINGGFAGAIHLVNPRYDAIAGVRAVKSYEDLPEAPDHLALFVPKEQTLEILELGGGLGARSASIYAAGFGEGGDLDGRARALRLKEILNRHSIAATGPNCMGLAVGRTKFCTFPDEQLTPLAPGAVAAITQSGMLGQTFARGIADAGLTLAYLVSCGNQTGLTFADYIDHLADDPDLRVITCYIEAVTDGPAFLAAAEKARASSKNRVCFYPGSCGRLHSK